MSVIRIGGTAFGTKSGAVFMAGGKSTAEALQSPGDYASPQPGMDEALGEIAQWGTNNLLPQDMSADIESTGVLAGALDGKSRIVIGKGPMPCRITGIDENGHETLAFITGNPINTFLETNRSFENSYALSKDLLGYGSCFVQFLLSADRSQIVGYKRIDTAKCRLGRVDPESGKSEWLYISADWQRWYTRDAATERDIKNIQRIPLLDKDFPLQDLQSRKTGFVFAMAIQYPLTNKNYYPSSPWYCAKKWVKIAQGIPELKEAMFKNQITIKYLVEVHPKFWPLFDPTYATAEPAQKKKIEDRFYDGIDEYLTGGTNAYKSFFSTMIEVSDGQGFKTISAITITAVDDKIKDGKFLPDSAAANAEILFPMMMNPAIMGADSPGGPYSGGAGSGSNIREALLLQVMLTEADRRLINQPLVLINAYNGYGEGIVFRNPQQLLTTLNTGANTQATA